MTIWYFLSIILLVLGFGFVIFWHELGHFIAAKAVGIKVEQFAVGLGQAIFSWRKGMGLRFGSSGKQFEELVTARAGELRRAMVTLIYKARTTAVSVRSGDAAAADLRISETEYRLNWMPLGGYVKMMGQDDLKPGASVDDPRAFNRKSVPARMLVVSAGVIMNIILAAIGFMILFLMGFNAPPAVVGSVVPNSPAAMAVKVIDGQSVISPLRVGDRILYLDDQYQHDFTKVPLTVALSEPGAPIPAYVERTDGRREHLSIVPARMGKDSSSFLAIGINPASELRGLDAESFEATQQAWGDPSLFAKDVFALQPGEVVTQVNGVELNATNGEAGYRNYAAFDQALQDSLGKPVELTVQNTEDGKVAPCRSRQCFPHQISATIRSTSPVSCLVPRWPRSARLGRKREAASRRRVHLNRTGRRKEDRESDPRTTDRRIECGGQARQNAQVNLTILREGNEIQVDGIVPNRKLEGSGKRGLGIALRPADNTIGRRRHSRERRPPPSAEIPSGATIKSVDGRSVQNWFELVHAITAGPRVCLSLKSALNCHDGSGRISNCP